MRLLSSDTRPAVLKALAAVIIWGASFVATKIAILHAPPMTIVWLRFGMGVVVLGAAVALRRQFAWPEKARNNWPYLALLGFLGVTLHQWLQSTGLLTSQAVTTGWIVASMPIFIAVLGWLVLREALGRLQALGILLAACGVLLVITRGDLRLLSGGHFGAPGDFLIVLSAPNWAVFTILSRRGLRKYPAALMMFYVMLLGWLFSFFPFAAESGWTHLAGIPIEGWLGVLFLGFFCSGIAYIFWYDALQALPVAQTGAFLYLEPVVTVIVSAALLHEEISPLSLSGGMVILLGVWLVSRR